MKRLAVAALGLLAGCAAPKSEHQIAAIAGKPPTQEQAERLARSYLSANLKDPDSMKQFALGSVSIVTWNHGILDGGRQSAGWLICFRYNAKNSYGGYVGLKPGAVVVQEFAGGYHVIQGRGELHVLAGQC